MANNWKQKPILPSIGAPKVKQLADFTEDEIKALERQYNMPVQRPKKRAGQEK